MTKRKRQPRVEVTEDYQEEYIDRKFKDFTIRVYPFPTGLFEKLSSQAESKFPYPDPPQKEIKTVDGPEIIKDTDNVEWLAEKDGINELRKNYNGKIVFQYMLDSCLKVLEYEKMIAKIEKLRVMGIEIDEKDFEADFITSHLVGTQNQYTMLITDSLSLTMTGDKEVAERLRSFQDTVEGKRTRDSNTSGVEE